MTDRQGQRIDKYRLVYRLGSGQFGDVYLGEHIGPQTQPPLAIKVLKPLAQDDLQDLLRFLNEVRASRLEHENIVHIYDFGVEKNIPFIVMEYAPHGTLRQRYPKGTLVPLPTIVSYVKQAASALQYIHDKRLIHRDVKPENMLLGEQDQILLSDFGIVTTSHSTFSQSEEEMAGTIPYIAPEQISGHPRPASDQYSLGVVVYEWLCGSFPFRGTIDEIIVKHQTVPPPSLSARIPTISPDVERVVMRALAKDPRQRFDSILDFAYALEQASLSALEYMTVPLPTLSLPDNTSSQPIPVPGSSPSPPPDSTPSTRSSTKPRISRRRAILGGTIVALAVAIGGLVVWLVQPKSRGNLTLQPTPTPSPTPQPTPTPIPPGTLLCTYNDHSSIVNAVAWSPDGKRIASGSDDKTVQVWNAADGSSPYIYKGHSNLVEAVAWSPDGKRIASGGFDQTVQVWNAADGSSPYTYTGHSAVVDAVVWSPDGKRIASGSYDKTVQVWNAADGGSPYTYTGHSREVRVVAWSPDGKRIVSGSFDGMVHVWDAVDGSHVLTYKGHSPDIVEAVAWSPDGRRIASSGRTDRTVQIWDATNGSLVFSYKGHSDVVLAVAWSPDGKRIASSGVDTTVQIWDALDGGHPFIYRQHSLEVRVVAWSPDGRLIASGGDDKTVQVWGAG